MKIISLSCKINAISLSICLIFILVSSSVLYFVGKNHLNYEYKQVNTLLSVLFEQKREEIANEIFAHQDLALKSSLNDIIKITGISMVAVYNKDGELLLSRKHNLISESHGQNSTEEGKHSSILPLNQPEAMKHLSQKQKELLNEHAVFLTNVNFCKDTASYSNAIKVIGEQIGYITIYYDSYPIKNRMTQNVTIFSFLFLLLALLISFLFHLLFSHFIVKPILKLKKAMGKVEQGTLGTEVDLDSKDEIGEIGSAFNRMSKKLLQNNTDLKNAVRTEENYALKLSKANASLKNLNTDLEIIVKKRTSELLKANDSLKKEIEEKEKMEDELLRIQKLESLGLLAGGIAHDFNNILGVIIGNLSLAQAYVEKNEKIATYLADTEKSCFRARDLTNQLLTFSRGGAPVKKLISMPKFIEESVVFVLRGSSIGYELLIAPDLFYAEIDQGQINQTINNIIINAVQAMPDGGRIKVKAKNFIISPDNTSIPLKEGNYIKIDIKDQGKGICNKNLQNIFDPYFTTKQTGNGLGLAMVHSIIKRHDGYISVQSEEAKGTTFQIYLPASIEKNNEDTDEPDLAVDPSYQGHGKILIMDDDEMIREVVGEMLILMGYEVHFSEDGAEACSKYLESMGKKEKFDLVIMDLTIPGGMGGKDAIKEILKIDPAAKVLVSSGYSNDPVMAEFKSYGFAGVVVKPFEMNELQSLLQKILCNYQSTDEYNRSHN